MSVFDSGSCESFKRGYHVAIGALFAGALGYNVIVLVKRPTLKGLVTVAVYSVGLAWERHICGRHRRS